jgi:hypothetical protein
VTFYENFLRQLGQDYPETAQRLDLRERLSPLLICPATVELSKGIWTQATEIVEAFFNLRQSPERKTALSRLAPELVDPGNYSALMSYDFHIDEQGRLRLIEINTNASMALIADLIYRTKGLDCAPIDKDFRSEIINTFRSEFSLSQKHHKNQLRNVAIIDEKPLVQRLYIEFELYRELFEQNSIHAVIADPRDLRFDGDHLFETSGDRTSQNQIDLVYNRDTDFYLETPSSEVLRRAMMTQAVCITPHPFEYRLLADKERLLELSLAGEAAPSEQQSVIAQSLIRTLLVSEVKDPDQLWAERKKWFFKPKRSFGGKAVYRGSSTSRGVFATILKGDYLAQEYVPPGTLRVDADGDSARLEVKNAAPQQPGATGTQKRADEFKFDLRFFVYKNEVQLACARLYQGQMTNSQTPGGGVAAIRWV